MIKFIILVLYVWAILFQLYIIKDEGGLDLFKIVSVKQKFVFVIRILLTVPILMLISVIVNIFENMYNLVEKVDDKTMDWGR